MQITKDCVVTIQYSLKEKEGAELESNQDGLPMAYLHGHRNILPALEAALEGLAKEEKKEVVLLPEQAYGHRRENAQQKVPIKHLAGKYRRLLPGTLVKVNTEKGVIDARVIKTGKFMVELDMNHPFAGKTLVFNVRVMDVRAATLEEIAHGHAHGEGGHQH